MFRASPPFAGRIRIGKSETEGDRLGWGNARLAQDEGAEDRVHLAARSVEYLAEFLVKADYVAREIAAGRFYKRPGKWRSWCDYLPVCLKDEKRIGETLVKIAYAK